MNQNNIKFKDNPFQYTRGVCFRAEPQKQSYLFKQKSKLKDSKVNLLELSTELLDFYKKLKKLLFYPEREAGGRSLSLSKKSNQAIKPQTFREKDYGNSNKQSLPFQKSLSINKSWLKTWHKNIFHLWIKDSNNKQGKYALNSEIYEISFHLRKWLENWQEKSVELKSFFERSQNQKVRDSEIAETIRFFLNRSQWDYIYQFLTELSTKEVFQDEQIKFLNDNLKALRENLKIAEQTYSSSQSSGIEITKASFNYYTLNKKPKEYYEDKIKKAKNLLYGFDCSSRETGLSRETSPSRANGNPKNSSNDKYVMRQNQTQSEKNEPVVGISAFSIIKKSKNNMSYKWEHNLRTKQEIFCFKSEQEKLWIERVCKICFRNRANSEKEWNKRYCPQCEKTEPNRKALAKAENKNEVYLSLDQSYTVMKAFKAEQKSLFYEVIAHIASKKSQSYEVKNNNHILKGWGMPYSQMNFKGINNTFSLFQFEDKKFKKNKKPQYTLDKMLSQYKDNQNKTTAEKCYSAFIELSKQIQYMANRKNQKLQIQHPKHKFLSSRNKSFKSQPRFYNMKSGQNTKKSRGDFLFGKQAYFKGYGHFCEKYKNIAQKRGQFIAQIKGVEREKQESQQTDFWSFIYCEKDKKQLWLVPKELRQKAREFIYDSQKETSNSQLYLCCFESLSFRALHKLCFAEQSSFVEEMPDDLKNLQKEVKKFPTKGDKLKLKEKNLKTLKFLKEVLNSDYTNEKLKLDQSFPLSFSDCPRQAEIPRKRESKKIDQKNSNWIKNNLYWIDESESLEEFEKSLEEACYHIKTITFTEEEKQRFLKNFDVTVLDISSYDLKGRNKNTYQSPESPDRLHTYWWKAFWSKSFPSSKNQNDRGGKANNSLFENIRLNPEVKIRYRKADEHLKEYFTKKQFPNSFKNRRLKEQWTIHFTLALNAGKKYDDLAFSKPEEILEKIKSFNKKLNEEMDFKSSWKYGIDRGQKELATLCLAQFNPEDTYTVGEKTIPKPKFPNAEKDIKCWTLQDYSYLKEYKTVKGEEKKCYAVKNPSYFMEEKYLNDRTVFKQESISCLDLTTAKVIKGRIITNGDVLTYLKLKKIVAKRELYKLYYDGKIKPSIKLEWSQWENGDINNSERKRPEGVLNIKTSDGEKTIYWYRKEYENIPLQIDEQGNIQITYNKSSIQNSLNNYLQQLKQENNTHTPTILEVNHLRDAITANMVGVICHLQKKYPGFIILEDLKKHDIDKHFFQSNENIARRLEYALYNKFQTLSLVPPHVKDIIRLREENKKSQDNKNKQKDKKSKGKHKNSNNIMADQLKSFGSVHPSKQDTGKFSSELNLSQVGAIVFVPEEDTSKTCPYCEKKKEAEKKQINDEKYRQHRFLCDRDSCGFDTYFFKLEEERAEGHTPLVNESKRKNEFELFKDIKDNDKVAGYNIAKKDLANSNKV